MKIQILKSKIHRVKITGASLDYIGSITVDEDLLNAANLIEGEKVLVTNLNNGERIETYILKGKRGSGIIQINGAGARKMEVGDIIIILSYGIMNFEKAKTFKPSVIFPDEITNTI